MTPAPTARHGICCSGTWIIDHVKMIDFWPRQDTLANIVAEELATGGAPSNVIFDLARFDVGLELSALGLVGDDSDGERILADCRSFGIDTTHLRKVPGTPTAYTDVMTVRESGRRTFFHNRGANALLGPEHFPLPELRCRILTLGYLLLLDGMDAADEEHGTRAARLLASCREHGIVTAVDIVSEDSDRFERIVTPALPHIDHLIINELEAGRTTGRDLRPADRLDRAGVEAAVAELLDRGVRELVVVHTPEVCYGVRRGEPGIWQAAHQLPPDFVRGTAGAGDAFFAGVVLGIHEGWPLARSLRFANAAAASCLRHPTTTGGVGSAEEIHRLADSLPLRSG